MATTRDRNEEQLAWDKAKTQNARAEVSIPEPDEAYNEYMRLKREANEQGPTSLAEHKPQAPALLGHASDEYDAFGDFRPDEIVLPITRLVQGTSRDIDPRYMGQFLRNVDSVYKPELLVALLGIARSRALFTGANLADPPVCASADAIVPLEVVETSPPGMTGLVKTGPTCAECVFSQWGSARDAQGNERKGQACKFTYNVLMLDLDDHMVSVMRIGGTSLMPFRNYMTGGKMGKRPAWAVETTITSERQEFDQGVAYVLKIRAGNPIEDTMAEEIRASAAAYRGVSLGVADIVADAE